VNAREFFLLLTSQALRTCSSYYHIHPSIQSWTFSRIESSTTLTHTL